MEFTGLGTDLNHLIKKADRIICRLFAGGDEEDRTPYLLNAIQALSQVSYTPKRLLYYTQ